MWLLWIITIVNVFMPQEAFLSGRFNVAGLPINIFDLFLPIGILMAIRGTRGAPGERTHPLLIWTLVFFLAATFGGFFASQTTGATTYELLNTARNFIVLGLCIFLGYRLLSRPRAAHLFLFVQIAGGVVVGLLILSHFGQRVQDKLSVHGGINALRVIAYISIYSGTAGVFLVIAILAGLRVMPTPICLALSLVMIVGQSATLSRSEWVSDALTLIVSLVLVPKARVVKGVIQLGVTLLIFAVVMSAGVALVSRVGELDMGKYISEKVGSLDPTDESSGHAWDSRLPGSTREFQLGLESPLFGRGFGFQSSIERVEGRAAYGFYHNVWTATFCQCGVLGLISICLTVFGCFFIGRKLLRARTDKASAVWGAFTAVTGIYFFFIGLTTFSFNTERGAIPLGLVFGMALRARAKQLALLQQLQEHQVEATYNNQSGYLDYEQPQSDYLVPDDYDAEENAPPSDYGAYPAY